MPGNTEKNENIYITLLTNFAINYNIYTSGKIREVNISMPEEKSRE